MTSIPIIHTVDALRAQVQEARAAGKRIGFVPTMGALHEGHLSLVAEAKREADFVVVSIFVNPLQFGAGEDFDRYPRTLESDRAALDSQALADVIFAPSPDEVYPILKTDPTATPAITVHAGPVGDVLEGVIRPGHFDGMLTVVSRLFDIVQPDVAVFGAKDAQQVYLVKQMAARLHPELKIITAPTIREASGLAMSSRNRYLSKSDAIQAEVVSAALRAADRAARNGDSPSQALEAARSLLDQAPTTKLEYLAAVDASTFEPIDDSFAGEALLLIAAKLASTRLIDNMTTRFNRNSTGAKA